MLRGAQSPVHQRALGSALWEGPESFHSSSLESVDAEEARGNVEQVDSFIMLAKTRTRTSELRAMSVQYDYEQLRVATQNFAGHRRVGAGGFGAVYRAEMKDGSEAAVKMIDWEALGVEAAASSGFEEEIAVLSRFRHPNLILLMGWGKNEACRFLVYEFLSGGDVAHRLKECKGRGPPFLWRQRLQVALDAATGLAYLHNATPRAFHRDVKTPNILLQAHGAGAKMADFGLSCVSAARAVKEKTTGHPKGTPGYICPIYASTGRLSEASEVYSFGIVLLELLLNLYPSVIVPDGLAYPIDDVVRLHEKNALQRAIDGVDAVAQWLPGANAGLAALALQCVDMSENRRPVFTDICHAIRLVRRNAEAEASMRLPPRSSSPSMVLAVAAGASLVAELLLDVMQVVFCPDPGLLAASARSARLRPHVEADGQCSVLVGKASQAEWFSELFGSSRAVLEKTISDHHFVISWGGSGGAVVRPTLRRLRNTLPLWLDQELLPVGKSVPICEGVQIQCGYVGDRQWVLVLWLAFARPPTAAANKSWARTPLVDLKVLRPSGLELWQTLQMPAVEEERRTNPRHQRMRTPAKESIHHDFQEFHALQAERCLRCSMM